jgi:hypothetical protein
MLRALGIAALLLPCVACGGKKVVQPPVSTVQWPSFVDIDLSAEHQLLENTNFVSDLRDDEARRTECGDLQSLEPTARLGALDAATIACLDDLMRDTERLTGKDKISRVLLVDAWEKGDRHRWENIARFHLENIDQSDADLAYQMAYQLVTVGNPERMDEAMHWAAKALERRQEAWDDADTFVTRTYRLHKFRTVAGLKKWQYVESLHERDPSRANRLEADAARDVVKTLSREWLEYSFEAGRDRSEPQRICEMATGLPGPCTIDR